MRRVGIRSRDGQGEGKPSPNCIPCKSHSGEPGAHIPTAIDWLVYVLDGLNAWVPLKSVSFAHGHVVLLQLLSSSKPFHRLNEFSLQKSGHYSGTIYNVMT
jgi:hypothetical protein